MDTQAILLCLDVAEERLLWAMGIINYLRVHCRRDQLTLKEQNQMALRAASAAEKVAAEMKRAAAKLVPSDELPRYRAALERIRNIKEHPASYSVDAARCIQIATEALGEN